MNRRNYRTRRNITSASSAGKLRSIGLMLAVGITLISIGMLYKIFANEFLPITDKIIYSASITLSNVLLAFFLHTILFAAAELLDSVNAIKNNLKGK
jgi:hypothetical protein